MRIIRFISEDGQTYLGEEANEQEATILTGDLNTGLTKSSDKKKISKLLAPIKPENIFCIGLNYREHAEESGVDIPERPVVFMKPTSTLNHPGDPIVLPACQHDSETDYECELAVIIGTECRNVSQSNALDYVIGYTCGHDVSARTWQLHGGGGQWIRGKGFDSFCPLGPAIVTTDEIPDPQILDIKTILNGQTMQSHTTGDMIFSVRELIEFLSQDTTLLPGTVIMTGTPQGVGFARKPPIWLQDGDEVSIEVENIGRLTNPVTAA